MKSFISYYTKITKNPLIRKTENTRLFNKLNEWCDSPIDRTSKKVISYSKSKYHFGKVLTNGGIIEVVYF